MIEAIVGGLAAGSIHVLAGPDHLAAVAPLAAERETRPWRAGLLWGVGHAAGVVVVCAGGGGIPVVANESGDLEGIAAVIDKDLASALLANQVDADLLLISTAVEQVALNFGTPEQRSVDQFTLAEVKQYLEEGGHFAEGSMAPKMRAVVQYMEAGGKEALITNPVNIERAMAGETGTRIVHG